jgi:hypothetical protein
LRWSFLLIRPSKRKRHRQRFFKCWNIALTASWTTYNTYL